MIYISRQHRPARTRLSTSEGGDTESLMPERSLHSHNLVLPHAHPVRWQQIAPYPVLEVAAIIDAIPSVTIREEQPVEA